MDTRASEEHPIDRPLDALLVSLAEEQLEAGAWKVPDPDEADAPRVCEVVECYEPLPPRAPAHQRTCVACRAAGFAAGPCKGCGGRIRRRDQMDPPKERRGYCATCRADMPQRQSGARNLAALRARRFTAVRRFSR